MALKSYMAEQTISAETVNYTIDHPIVWGYLGKNFANLNSYRAFLYVSHDISLSSE